ncbi:hypothetical protein [Arthrobacter sp. OV608]|uniref:hypothetical protein n=1 Tax=Arthrobacter sp. OV608 TaxID=1882768 RepID=UPI0008CC1DF2|nr:hypothetical protein [Arthrobacter sp. OV608]SEQ80147.1 hypothetical protein SAMN05444745_11157 [Arthrobacter sp. OV608]
MSTEYADTGHANSRHTAGGQESADLRVEVGVVPEPGLLRPAIEAALMGRAWPAGPEAAVAEAVAARVADAQQSGAGAW